LEVGAEEEFKLDLRQDLDPGKQKLKDAVRTETHWRHYCQQQHPPPKIDTIKEICTLDVLNF
jgi:hypothetical protein